MPTKVQRIITALSIVLFGAKLFAWYLTNSVAILTDALESTVNVITGFIGLYSVNLAARPRDRNHPFGHGKIEFISAGIEGAMIMVAGLAIIYEAVDQLIYPQPLKELSMGMIITALAGVVNLFAGSYAVRQGKKHKSATIEAAGKHLRSDAYSTAGIFLGLVLLKLTGWLWLDSAVALAFALIILLTGYGLVRRSLAGIMDETDERLLQQVIGFLQSQRRPQWIDMHNMRVIQYGSVMHVDAHMTLPWYYRVADGEKEIHIVEDLIREQFGSKIEIFIHIDACAPYSCKLCALPNCPVRQQAYQHQIVWDLDNVWVDAKHGRPATEP